MSVIGLDVGGANIKAADGRGWALSRAFPLWKRPERLAGELRDVLQQAPEFEYLALTMTGELADCFAAKSEGVRCIIGAAVEAVDSAASDIFVYLTNGEFTSPVSALAQPHFAAASNWRALAEFARRFVDGRAVLIDIGSTTTDMVSLSAIGVHCKGRTDSERLTEGSLVYTGVKRTPIACAVNELPYRGQMIPVAAELFATTWDVYLTLNLLPEEPTATHTADGRPATKGCALDRLARMICEDRDQFDAADAQAAAEHVMSRQLEQLAAALKEQGVAAQAPIVASGEGEFLVRKLAERRGGTITASISEQLTPTVSSAACAHAVAILFAQMLQQKGVKSFVGTR